MCKLIVCIYDGKPEIRFCNTSATPLYCGHGNICMVMIMVLIGAVVPCPGVETLVLPQQVTTTPSRRELLGARGGGVAPRKDIQSKRCELLHHF